MVTLNQIKEPLMTPEEVAKWEAENGKIETLPTQAYASTKLISKLQQRVQDDVLASTQKVFIAPTHCHLFGCGKKVMRNALEALTNRGHFKAVKLKVNNGYQYERVER